MTLALRLLLALVGCWCMSWGKAADARRSVAAVLAGECGNRSTYKNGSGFVWRDRQYVVTALHVVAGCKTIGVRFEAPDDFREGVRIIRALRSHDLALLQLPSPTAVPVLKSAPVVQDSVVKGYGFPIDVNRMVDREYRITETRASLRQLLNTRIVRVLERAGVPDVDAQVHLVDRNILRPGQSGGPLVDARGTVVAVANGGLEQGAVGVNWVVSAAWLDRLWASREPMPSEDLGGQLNFAFRGDVVTARQREALERGAPTVTSAPIRCGGADLVRTKTRTLEEMAQFTDDLTGLYQIMGLAQQSLRADDEFAVYQHLESGATVVTPAEFEVRTSGVFCAASRPGGAVTQLFQVLPSSGFGEVAVKSVRFERDVMARLGPGVWQPNPAWSYPGPQTRPDGLLVNRKGLIQFDVTPQGPVPKAYVIETLAAREGMLLGVALVRSDLEPDRLRLEDACMGGRDEEACRPVAAELRDVSRLWAATHLSTFP